MFFKPQIRPIIAQWRTQLLEHCPLWEIQSQLFAALAVPALLIWAFSHWCLPQMNQHPAALIFLLYAAGALTWAVTSFALAILTGNFKTNPAFWKRAKPWLRPIASLLLMGLIFGWMIHKIAIHWADVRGRAASVSIPNFILASFLFAIFLFVFRSLVWRRILKRFGHRLPLAPAVRIWSSSELARYLPGVIWQVAGRVYLVRPYGVPGSVCAASQVLELVIFLLANILLGFGCLVVFGLRHIHGDARVWMYALALLVPLLALLLHPGIFYGLMNRVMAKLKKPPLVSKLSGAELSRLLVWNILGLLLQSVAVFLIVARPLGLTWAKWYVVTGAYCLAWCAGFLAVLNPGGLGVREAVFVAAMQFALPKDVRQHFANRAVLIGFLTFLSGLLRLWTIAGELILTGVAHAIDHRGALGRIPQPRPAQLRPGLLVPVEPPKATGTAAP